MASSSAIATLFVDFRAGVGQLDSDLKKVVRKFRTVGREFDNLGKSLSLAISAPIAAGLALVAKSTNDYEKALQKIERGSSKTGKELGELKKRFADTFKDSPATAAEIASAVTGIGRATKETGPEVDRLTKTVVALAKITESDVNETTKTSAKLMNAWGLSAGENR
jgi:phage-related minor tail protein